MKKLLYALLMMFFVMNLTAQVTPELMVIPSEIWMNTNGYMMEVESQGQIRRLPDYKNALISSTDLNTAITKIGEMFRDLGYTDLKSLNSSLNDLELTSMQEGMSSSRMSGSAIQKSPLDLINERVAPDIIIDLFYELMDVGPRRQINFNIQALDAYSSKMVASVSGTGEPSSQSSIPDLLSEAVVSYLPKFLRQIQDHFENIRANGRELEMRFLIFEDSQLTFEDDCGDGPYYELIDDWIYENTKSDDYDFADDSENRLVFEGLKIPLFYTDKRGRERKLSTRSYADQLEKYLAEKCGLDKEMIVVDRKGQGEVWFYFN